MARHLVNFHELHESCALYCPFCLSERVYQLWDDKKGKKDKSNFHTKRGGLKHLTNCAFRIEKIDKDKKFVHEIMKNDKEVTPTSHFKCISRCKFKDDLVSLKSKFRNLQGECAEKKSSFQRTKQSMSTETPSEVQIKIETISEASPTIIETPKHQQQWKLRMKCQQ